ncbi:MAG: transcriptional regulator GcvA [Pseudomonadota bacterium]
MTSPPLNALRAFEAAARHLSFKGAARELNVTPAAVSHQIKTLESWLGTPLFVRLTRALELTEAGKAGLPILSEGFEKLGQATEQMKRYDGTDVLTISVSPSFGAMWLVPKLDQFRARHPDIEIRIDGTDRKVNVGRGGADVAIRYGPGGYSGVGVDTLFSQLNTPVCSPSLISGKAPLRTPEDLRHHTLLHVQWKDADASWRMWLLAAGVTRVDDTKGPQFTQEGMAVQAALDGQGVALIGDKLVAHHLASGDLICPFSSDLRKPLNFAYHLLTPATEVTAPKIAAFREWILDFAD